MHLAAQMPPAKMGARGLMELRIARKIAALSGIAGDPESSEDAGGGRAWLSDYSHLTMTELTLGAPVAARSDDPLISDSGAFTRDGRRFVPVGAARWRTCRSRTSRWPTTARTPRRHSC